MALVVDASIALAWALPDESSTYADAVLAVVERDGLRVPTLWAREVANGLAVAHLRKRITSADENAFLTALSQLSTTVVIKYLEAEGHVFGSGRTVREIGAAFANQTKTGDVPDFASLATATERADGGFRLR